MSVDRVVGGADAPGGVGVEIDQGVEAVAEHRLDGARHLTNLARQTAGAGGGERSRLLGDVDRQVGDALEVVVELQHPDDVAKIDGHRLVEGEDLEALLLDVDLHLVDAGVGFDDLIGHPDVGGFHRRDGLVDVLLDERAQSEDLALELFDFFFEVASHASPFQGRPPPQAATTAGPGSFGAQVRSRSACA